MNKINQVLGAGMFLIMSMHTQANIKQNLCTRQKKITH